MDKNVTNFMVCYTIFDFTSFKHWYYTIKYSVCQKAAYWLLFPKKANYTITLSFKN